MNTLLAVAYFVALWWWALTLTPQSRKPRPDPPLLLGWEAWAGLAPLSKERGSIIPTIMA